MSRAEEVLSLLRADWQSVPVLLDKTGWKSHTLRGFLSIAAKKHKLAIERKRDSGVTSYRIAPDEYKARDDFTRSVDECYEEIRDRVAAGGESWNPK